MHQEVKLMEWGMDSRAVSRAVDKYECGYAGTDESLAIRARVTRPMHCAPCMLFFDRGWETACCEVGQRLPHGHSEGACHSMHIIQADRTP